MSYGLEVYAGGGKVLLNTSDWKVHNYLDSFSLPAGGGSGSKNYNLPSGRSIEVFCHNRHSGTTIVSYSCRVVGSRVYWDMHGSSSAADVLVLSKR